MIPGMVQNQDAILKRKYIDNSLRNIKKKPKLGMSKKQLGNFKLALTMIILEKIYQR